MKRIYPHRTRVLSWPLSNVAPFLYFFEVEQEFAMIRIGHDGTIQSLTLFENQKEYEKYFKTIKKKYKDEKELYQPYLHGGVKQGESIEFVGDCTVYSSEPF